jgi:hypothetical protein
MQSTKRIFNFWLQNCLLFPDMNMFAVRWELLWFGNNPSLNAELFSQAENSWIARVVQTFQIDSSQQNS